MVKIRTAVLEDLSEILAIYNEAVRTTTATFDLVEQTLEERFKWFSNYGDKYPLIVADYDKKIIGYCSLSPFNKKAAYEKTVELSIYLSRDHHGAGVGSLLMEEIITQSKKYGFHTIIGGITTGNERSVRLHEKFGFNHVGHLREVGFKFGEWQNVDYYQLLLD